ncbi:MAG TPA: DUF3987 domain-containing protein [Candidatus Dormibacteraeota bacterium]|nr:DUF3987 domain-containing protein [Candidatus Dormibacteraeota bacterium]
MQPMPQPPDPTAKIRRVLESNPALLARAEERRDAHKPADTSAEKLAETIAPAWPDSLAPEAFHGLAGEISRTIEPETEADPAAILIQFLLAFGGAVGRGPYFRVEADLHHTNLFAVLVGETSVARKGTSLGHVRRIMQSANPEWAADRILRGLSSGEGLIWCVRDPIEKTHPVREKGRVARYENILEDEGVADKRALVIETEFSSPLKVMAREGNTLSCVLRDCWDNGDLRLLTKNSPARSTGAHVSILGHVTRGELRRYLSQTEMGNGFANRFLWACVGRSRCLPDGGSFRIEDHPSLTSRLKGALDFGGQERELRRNEEASSAWREVYPSLSEGRLGLVGSVVSRAPAQVVRLSLIYALLDRSPEIRADHLLAALAVWQYCEASARFIFGDSLGYPEADRILAELRRSPKGLTRTKIRDLFGRNRSEGEIQLALDCLAEHGLAKARKLETGGREAEVWDAAWGTTETTNTTKGTS